MADRKAHMISVSLKEFGNFACTTIRISSSSRAQHKSCKSEIETFFYLCNPSLMSHRFLLVTPDRIAFSNEEAMTGTSSKWFQFTILLIVSPYCASPQTHLLVGFSPFPATAEFSPAPISEGFCVKLNFNSHEKEILRKTCSRSISLWPSLLADWSKEYVLSRDSDSKWMLRDAKGI